MSSVPALKASPQSARVHAASPSPKCRLTFSSNKSFWVSLTRSTARSNGISNSSPPMAIIARMSLGRQEPPKPKPG